MPEFTGRERDCSTIGGMNDLIRHQKSDVSDFRCDVAMLFVVHRLDMLERGNMFAAHLLMDWL